MFKDYFYCSVSSTFTKKLYETKSKKENNELVNVIKSGLIDLKNKIKETSEDEKKNIKEPDKIFKIVEEILEFNKQKQSGLGLRTQYSEHSSIIWPVWPNG